MDWLATFLPRLRCPLTHEPLRLATDAEIQLVGTPSVASALINQSGTLLYPVVEHIPHLLPGSAITVSPASSLS